MEAVGIICEYNPFHRGHEKQLRMIRAQLGADMPVVCLMSGSFVQRGAPALFAKSVRARAAVECGASLVLELPVSYALRSAEGFARGGVEILSRLGAVDALCFGCESGDGGEIWRAVQAMCSPEYDTLLRVQLSQGLSYPAARQRALEALCGGGMLLRAPNDILAVEYCKAIIQQQSALRPMAIRREGGYHDVRADAENPSATAVRACLDAGNEDWRPLVPAAAAALYADAPRYTMQAGERAVLARLRGLTQHKWQSVPFGSEGLWSKVYRAVQTQTSVDGIIDASVSRRYPRTRLQRMVMCAYLGITDGQLHERAPYVRVLAFDAAGRALLRQMHARAPEYLVHAGQRVQESDYAQLEARSEALYALFCEGTVAADEKNRVFQKKT